MKPILRTIPFLLTAALHAQTATKPLSGPGVIKLEGNGKSFTLKRDGTAYPVKGVGGSTNLDLAAASGANSIRLWGTDKMDETLDIGRRLGMTVTIGIWLDHNAAMYRNEGYKDRIRKEMAEVVRKAKRNPATLCYALGNETNSGADTEEAWKFINEVAEMVKKEDPDHPTMTVLAGSSVKTINNVARFAPAIDILGVNSYRGLGAAARDVASSDFKGPYMVTEWGPWGHWEVAKTPWGAPLEQTSDEKAKSYQEFYQMIAKDDHRCIGSYVFLWGQKQERTPTWYSMFVENYPPLGVKGESTITVDVMTQNWTGKPPKNRAPSIKGWKIGSKSGERHFTLKKGDEITAEIEGADPDGDQTEVVWEVIKEATTLGQGGSKEPRPASVKGVVKDATNTNQITLTGSETGNYRLFGYVLDGKGKAATINIPYQVK